MLRIGTAGWILPAQARDSFPAGESHLARYSALLNCAEINSSFHRPHRRATYERWAATVPDHFRFSLKVPKEITHVKRCSGCYDVLARFIDESASLGSKRAVLLVQLPPTFRFDRSQMERFFSDLRSLYNDFAVCEPRHASWFASDADVLLREFRIAYFRLHGAPRTYYSRYAEEAIGSIAMRLRRNKAPEQWCIFDNTAAGAAIDNALELAGNSRL